MEQPGAAMLRMEKVLEADAVIQQFEAEKEAGRKQLWRSEDMS